jgi:hypothetical protein
LAITALAFDSGKSLAPATSGGEETAKGIMEALRAITIKAHFTHDPHGGLHPVKTHVRWVHPSEYEQTQSSRVQKTLEAIKKLRDGNGKPPYLTTMHMRLGKIGLSYARLSHIIENREKRGQNVDECLEGIAACLVYGDPKKEPITKDNKRESTPQIWVTVGKHQVTLSPFWESPDSNAASSWVVSGYEITETRQEETKNADPVAFEIQNQQEPKT